MKFARALFAATTIAAFASVPAQAGGIFGGGIPVPEPSDAILLLMGVAGVVIGRKLHARANKHTDG